jgi:LDH2 family malate/lactate/ureidoglycolate dehydrogenase
MMMDIATCVWPEGKLRMARYRNQPLPEGVIIDSDGNPTTDPARFYGPPGGALLPFGGIVGHKVYALTILPDLLGGLLSGSGIKGRERPGTGNGLFFQAINIADFTPVEEFIAGVKDYNIYIKSSRRAPGVNDILLPGEPEYRLAKHRAVDGVPVDDSIWEEIQKTAQELSVRI